MRGGFTVKRGEENPPACPCSATQADRLRGGGGLQWGRRDALGRVRTLTARGRCAQNAGVPQGSLSFAASPGVETCCTGGQFALETGYAVTDWCWLLPLVSAAPFSSPLPRGWKCLMQGFYLHSWVCSFSCPCAAAG